MPTYIEHNGKIHFRQSSLPRLFFVALGQLDIYIEITGSHRYPYAVQMSVSEFESCIELSGA